MASGNVDKRIKEIERTRNSKNKPIIIIERGEPGPDVTHVKIKIIDDITGGGERG